MAVTVPPNGVAGLSHYRKMRDRASYAFALVSVAAGHQLEGGTIKDVRIALGGVAHKPWRAERAEASPVTALSAAKANGAEPGLFKGESLKQKVGDAKAALATAPHKVDVLYTTPRRHHNPIELHACTLAWEGDTLRGSPMPRRR
jgi:CO/xanthine dehydrogenase FAD-binding subunit